MPSSSIQFHVDPVELLDLLKRWAGEEGLWCVTEVEPRSERVFDYGFPESGTWRRARQFMLRTEPFISQDARRNDFIAANSGCLIVAIGTLAENTLRETYMSAIIGREGPHARWRTAFGRARRELHRGAFLINSEVGRAWSPNHRYSDGAKRLATHGVELLAIAGEDRYEIAEDDSVPQGRPPLLI